MSTDKRKSVGKSISYLYRQFQMYINHEMKPYNINSSEYIYLAEIGEDEVVNQTHFTEALSIDPALTTRVMKNLEKKGYVTRTKGVKDKRTVMIHLTDKGREIQPILIDKLTGWTECLTQGLDEKDHDYIYEALLTMSENVNNKRKEKTNE